MEIKPTTPSIGNFEIRGPREGSQWITTFRFTESETDAIMWEKQEKMNARKLEKCTVGKHPHEHFTHSIFD